MRRLPLIPTIVVALAVAAMIGLGIWQLGRAREKEALLAQYRGAEALPPIAYPTAPMAGDRLPLFRRSTGYCLSPAARRATAGRNRSGESGYIHIIGCRTGAEGPGMSIEVGWSKNPNAALRWSGGEVSGTIVPDREARMRLVADKPAPGLQPSAPPTPEDIPNNHLWYAVQWFLFAILAAVIYALALRKRSKTPPGEPKP